MLSETDDRTLMALRIIWVAMVAGQIGFGVVIFMVGPHMQAWADPHLVRLLFYIALGMLILDVPLVYLVRAMIYRTRRAPDGTVNIRAYMTGNIVFYALLECVSFVALVGWMMSHGQGPHVWIAAAALALQALNFPTGAPLTGGGF